MKLKDISTIHINQEKTMKCLQNITDYNKETMKNTTLTIQVIQQEIRNSHGKWVTGVDLEDSHPQ